MSDEYVIVSDREAPRFHTVREVPGEDLFVISKLPMSAWAHSVEVIIPTKELLADMRKHLKTTSTVTKNFYLDMPRCTFNLDGIRIRHPATAMKKLSDHPRSKDILRLSTATSLGKAYETVCMTYVTEDAENLHISDSCVSPMLVRVRTSRDRADVTINKTLQLTHMNQYGEIILGMVNMILECSPGGDSDSRIAWSYIPLSSV